MRPEIVFDHGRLDRTGLPEAVYCPGKTTAQLQALLDSALDSGKPLLLTRLSADNHRLLQRDLDYDPLSLTAYCGAVNGPTEAAHVAIVVAGTADLPVAREAARSLNFFGLASDEYVDVGVAGLWRLLQIVDRLRTYPVLIAVAGMDGALFSVLGGLVPSAIVSVPTSVGYGTAKAGETALHSALCSCAQGLLVVNIDNGFGAACAAKRLLASLRVLGGPVIDPKGIQDTGSAGL